MEEDATGKKRRKRKKPATPPDPNKTGVGRKHPKPKPKHPKGKPHPRAHPRPHPGAKKRDHRHHRAPHFVSVGKYKKGSRGWIAAAALAVADSSHDVAWADIKWIGEVSSIVEAGFNAETLVAEEDGPELDAPVAAAYLAEGLVCALLITALYFAVALLMIALFLHKVAISVGPFQARIGALFDPLVKMMEALTKTIGHGLELVIGDTAVAVLWLTAKLTSAIGLMQESSFRHFWHSRFIPLYGQVQWLRHQIHGINHVLFSGKHSVLGRLAHIDHRIAELWAAISAFESQGGKTPNVNLKALEQRLAAQESQIQHINRTLPRLAQHLKHLDAQGIAQHHRLTVEAHAISQLQTHVRAIEYTLAHLTPTSLKGIQHEITVIEHELQSLGHFPLTHIENQIHALERGMSWLDSLHPGRFPAEIAALEAGLSWLESLHPGRFQHELDVLTQRLDSLPRVHYHEIETQIQRLQREIDTLEHLPHTGNGMTPQEKAQLHSAYHISLGLAPLLALAPFGADFMRHIAKLRTCEPQCIGANIVPPDIIDALVADFVAKDGF